MHLLRRILFLFVFLVPVGAYAQNPEIKKSIETVKEWYTDFPFRLNLNYEYVSGVVDGNNFTEYSGTLRVLTKEEMFPFRIYMDFGGSKSWVTYENSVSDGAEDPTIYGIIADLNSPKIEFIIGSGIHVKLFKRGPWSASTEYSFLATPETHDLELDRLTLTIDGAQSGFSGLAAEHSAFSYTWSRMHGQLSLQYDKKPITLSATLGVTKFSSKVSINVDDVGTGFLELIGLDSETIEKPIDLIYVMPNLQFGATIHIKNTNSFTLAAGILPVRDDAGDIQLFTTLNGTIGFRH